MNTFKNITHLARDLRRNQTESECLLWFELRNRKLTGFKFLRQHPIVYASRGKAPLFFIADFYCSQKYLVLEVDGKIHDFQKDRDYQRDLILKLKGLDVLRITNEEVKDMKSVLQKIRNALGLAGTA